MVAIFVVLTICFFMGVDLIVQKIQASERNKIRDMSYDEIKEYVGLTMADGGEPTKEA